MSKVYCFDLTKQLYYCGIEGDKKVKTISLKEFIAIQVIKKRIYGDSSNFDSFELNIVMKSGDRINVIDYSEGDYVKCEAQELAKFLDIELCIY